MSDGFEYEKLACQVLSLVHPNDKATFKDILLELGNFRIIESEAALNAVIDRYIQKINKRSTEHGKSYQEKSSSLCGDENYSEQYDRLQTRLQESRVATEQVACLSYQDYLRYHNSEDAKEEQLLDAVRWKFGGELVKSLARLELSKLQRQMSLTADLKGYKRYLKLAVPRLYERLSRDVPALVPEQPRQEHSYIVATSGVGKSELIKALCLNYVREQDYAGIVVLDPGGDMVREIARWPELVPQDRLVYIDLVADKKVSPVINPFDAEHLDQHDRNLLTEQIVAAIGTLVEGKVGGTISVNMEAVLYPSVRMLVDEPNTSLRDLLRLMKGDERLLAMACQSKHKDVAEFFSTEFNETASLKMTKQSIAVKLRNILGKGTLDRLISGRTSIDLEKLMADKKVILLNLAKGSLGRAESSAIGTLLVSLIQSIAMKRERIPKHLRPTTHLIVDECQNFVTGEIKTIIREARKFGLPLTLAQQEVGGEMASDLERVVARTTVVKIAGRSAIEETRRSGPLVGVKPEEMVSLPKGQFYYKNGIAPAFLLRVRTDRLGTKGAISDDHWRCVMTLQKKRYYREPEHLKMLSHMRESPPPRPHDETPPSASDTGYEFD